MSWFWNRPWGIRLKMALITLVLIAATTFGAAVVIFSIMNQFLLDSLLRQGASVALSAASPAGFSILVDDQLALDNLVAKVSQSQPDVSYIGIVDSLGIILAHNNLAMVGKSFEEKKGRFMDSIQEVEVKRVESDPDCRYEIKTSIRFADNKVGEVIVGLKDDSLVAAKQAAHKKIFSIAALTMAFGIVGTIILSSFLTAPVKRLADGVSRVKAGSREVEIKVTSRDELGDLTRSFNEMSKTLRAQQESLEKYASNLEDSYTSMVRILAAALDARDQYTLGHSARVAWLSLQVGKKLGLDKEELKELEMACFLHDIGKIKIPDMILAKSTPLDKQEYEIIKQHPVHGAEILSLSASLLRYIPVVLQHHEWHNGKGYPYGLRGDEIHQYAQIVAIGDCYDAMTTSRPYRRGRSRNAAAREIKKYKGSQFSPDLVDVFLDTINDIDKVREIPFAGEYV